MNLPTFELSTFKLSILACCLLLGGCSYSEHNIRPYVSWTGLVPLQKTTRDSGWAIDVNAKIYVAGPATGFEDDALITEINDVFLAYFPHTRSGQYRESLNQAFVSARYAGMDYVVYPKVTDYQDQETLGSVLRGDINVGEFQRGKAHLEIYIYASQGEEIVDHIKLNTKGSIFTSDSRKLIWPPLHAYLKQISQFNLEHR